MSELATNLLHTVAVREAAFGGLSDAEADLVREGKGRALELLALYLELGNGPEVWTVEQVAEVRDELVLANAAGRCECCGEESSYLVVADVDGRTVALTFPHLARQ